MNANPASTDWSTTRGEKWLAHLPGMEATLGPVDAPLIGALQLEVPCRIAEVGCGGGGTALEVLRRASAGSVVHGFDISPRLVEVARARLRPDAHGIAFDVADMAKAAPERPYDRLFSRFGVMFFDDPPAAFANLVRWLAPGGRFAFAVWGRPSDNPWISVVREEVARLVEVPQPDSEGPGPFRYAEVDTLRSLLERAGFTGVEAREWRGTLPIGGGLAPAEAAHFALSAFSTFGELLAQAGDSALREARRSLTARLSDFQQDGAVRLGACVHLVTGTRG